MYLNEKLYADQEVKADPFTLEALIAWLETKNPKERYCYEKQPKHTFGQALKRARALQTTSS